MVMPVTYPEIAADAEWVRREVAELAEGPSKPRARAALARCMKLSLKCGIAMNGINAEIDARTHNPNPDDPDNSWALGELEAMVDALRGIVSEQQAFIRSLTAMTGV